MNVEYRHDTIPTNAVNLHVVQAGAEDGKLAILLHGFPEFWYEWRGQIKALADAGYRLWVPDQRGYNLSDKPPGVASYTLDVLAQDVIGLVKAAGSEKCLLVGHDFGGAVAWWMANRYPELLEKLVIINVPHHRIFGRELRKNWAQKRRSWYMYYFQLPWLPEFSLRIGRYRQLAALFRPPAYTSEDMELYRQAWSQPGALTGMLNWYRAGIRLRLARLPDWRIKVPTLLIWGRRDPVLHWSMAQPSIDLCDDGRLVFIDDANHWVPAKRPDRVNQLILDFWKE